MRLSKCKSSTLLTAWVAIAASWGCHTAFAFAFTKIPKSLLDDRHPHEDRRNRHQSPKQPIVTTFASPSNKNRKHYTSVLSSTAAQEGPENSTDDASINKGRMLLAMVALLYGTLNVSLRFVYEVPDVPPTAAALSATRGWLAFLCFLPPLVLDRLKQKTEPDSLGEKGNDNNASLFRSGLELATWGFLAQGLLNVGLVSTGSARASFLTQASVLFTPLISTLIGKQSVAKNVWLACMVALVGLVVLTMGAGGSAAAGVSSAFAVSLSKGDLFVLGGALSWSMYLFRVNTLGPKHPDLILQGVKTGLMAVLYSVWWISGGGLFSAGKLALSSLPSWMTSSFVVWAPLFFSAIGPGTIADVLQQKGQKDVSPSEANILLSAEPVFATIFAVLLLGEKTSLLEMGGGALILMAAVIASF